jgi:hypothetical protein
MTCIKLSTTETYLIAAFNEASSNPVLVKFNSGIGTIIYQTRLVDTWAQVIIKQKSLLIDQ